MKIAFHTLGCKVNQYETEAMIEQFRAKGHEIVNETDFAHVYIINTCSVTHLADRKSRQYIRKMKRVNPESIVAVTGCYAQVNPEEVEAIEGVNIVAGTNEKQNIVSYVENYISEENKQVFRKVKPLSELNEYKSSGIITSMESRTRAYIKIQEGCNRFCSYCIIPYARGEARSRPLSEILEEAKGLIESGFKELILTGINTALYGTDLGYESIEPLISKLNSLEGDFRIRLSSLEPTVINAEQGKKLMKYEKLCPHMHLSIQSGSNKVISAMNRKYTREEYLEIVRVLKEKDPMYGITTDIIVGFPMETEEDFNQSLDIAREAGFLKVHVFKYSKRRGTKAAEMKEQIPSTVKKERSEKLISVSENVSRDFFRRSEGEERRVLFEEYMPREKMACGYTENYIKVYAKGEESMVGEFYKVKLLKEYKDGMKGEILNG